MQGDSWQRLRKRFRLAGGEPLIGLSCGNAMMAARAKSRAVSHNAARLLATVASCHEKRWIA